MFAYVGCATFTYSPELKQKLESTNTGSIDQEVLVVIEGTRKSISDPGNRWYEKMTFMNVPFSRSEYSWEVEAVQKSGVFRNIKWPDETPSSGRHPKVKISIDRFSAQEGCPQLDGYLFPKTDKIQFFVSVLVFDENGESIFLAQEQGSAEHTGTLLDFTQGIMPLWGIRRQGPGVLIQRALARFRDSDAFGKLSIKGDAMK